MGKLVIVESPAKARTIEKILGAGYDVQASFGHVRDLPENADQVPPEIRKTWGRLGVNVDADFEPIYVVPTDKKRHVDNLKRSARDADELILATDGDREGESISWHILQLLKPKKSVPVRRIIFHELTPEAILAAVANPGQIDEALVRAQETRRILDRLFGYSLSPLLWKKVATGLSAGRVQSVAVRLCVERERERARFVVSEYWDLAATLIAERPLKTTLSRIDDRPLASGKSFDETTGDLKDLRAIRLTQADAEPLAERAAASRPWTVTKLESSPGTRTPPVPFMTSTLQQEANRKLRMSAKRAMQAAQRLYEGIDLGGERVGLITYMRTDSLNLAERALAQAREVIADLYGTEYLPPQPVRYRTKSKNAQEAHEAIRPTDLARRPQDVRRFLGDDEFALYELIWKRTIACQMVAARVQRSQLEVAVDVDGRRLTFGASGTQILFPGFLKAYVEGSDDPDAELADQDTVLPAVKVGDVLEPREVVGVAHRTKPPARFTEASLVKRLEDEGVGRPSTYASIIGTIQDRGYVVKRGNELVPTFTAFAVTELLEQNFEHLVDLKFTARLEEELDEIAAGKMEMVEALRDFYFGEGDEEGLMPSIVRREKEIPYPAVPLGETADGQPVVVRVGRYGTFVQRGEGGAGNRANVPEEIAPADFTLESAIELIERRAAGPAAIAHDPASGRAVFLMKGRFGPYLEFEQTPEEKESGLPPRRLNVPDGFDPSRLADGEMDALLSLPRTVGDHPDSGEPIVAKSGKYGPYIECGKERRNLEGLVHATTIGLGDAVALLAAPPVRRGRTAAKAEPKPPLREFGALEGFAGPVRILDGRYGPYVTDGTTHATLPKGADPAEVTTEEAAALLRERAAAGGGKKRTARTTRAGARTATRRTPAKATRKKKA